MFMISCIYYPVYIYCILRFLWYRENLHIYDLVTGCERQRKGNFNICCNNSYRNNVWKPLCLPGRKPSSPLRGAEGVRGVRDREKEILIFATCTTTAIETTSGNHYVCLVGNHLHLSGGRRGCVV